MRFDQQKSEDRAVIFNSRRFTIPNHFGDLQGRSERLLRPLEVKAQRAGLVI